MVSITFKKINPPNYFLQHPDTIEVSQLQMWSQKLSHFQINEPGNVFQGSWGFLTVLPDLFELLSTRKVTNTLWGASAEPWRRASFDDELRENLVNNQSNSLGFTPPNPLFRNILALRGRFWGFTPPCFATLPKQIGGVKSKEFHWFYCKNQHRRRFCGVWQLNLSLGNIARRRRENFGICDPFALVSTPETWFFFTETS